MALAFPPGLGLAAELLVTIRRIEVCHIIIQIFYFEIF